MKKRASLILACITAGFVLFTLGFFLGRNAGRPAVITGQIAPLWDPAASSPTGETGKPETTAPTVPDYPININTADAQALAYLPGIGQTIAQRIVDYRDANGDFARISDLLNVKGIGQTRLEEILPYITVGQQEETP